MEIVPGPVIIEPATNRQAGQSQPIQALANLDAPLDDAQVRAAIAAAEANNQDPQTLKLEELAQAPATNPPPAVVPPAPTEVPPKFLKPDGGVDVEKIQASTKQLDEAIQNREPAPAQKTVDDYLKEYQEKEKLFHNTVPKAQLPPTQTAQLPPEIPGYEDIVRRDYAIDPLGTTTKLFDLMLQNKFKPIEERERMEATRGNLQALAAKDPRILREDVFAKVNEKLQNDPDLWRLKNPHKAAFLEVKEEMRLGDPPVGSQAQPSRPLSPVLGGGTPPSTPSSQVPSQQIGLASLDALDLRDKKQEAAGDEAIRRALMGNRE